MSYTKDPRVDAYIDGLPHWQQAVCQRVRDLVHATDPQVQETIKRRVRPYFVLDGNICALLAAKDHVNVFLYDGAIVPDPERIITGGHDNKTARTVAIYEDEKINEPALAAMFRQIIANNRAGGWAKTQGRATIYTPPNGDEAAHLLSRSKKWARARHRSAHKLGPRRASHAADSKLLTSALRLVSRPRPTNKLRLEKHLGKSSDPARVPKYRDKPLTDASAAISFAGVQAKVRLGAASAARAIRPVARSSAPPLSSALVALASRRPVRPDPPRTPTEARTSLPPSTGSSAYRTSIDIGPAAVSSSPSASAAWTSTSKPTRLPASEPLTRVTPPALRRRPSNCSTSNGIGDQLRISSGSVSTPSTCSRGALIIVFAVN